jgi:hypothetical protein
MSTENIMGGWSEYTAPISAEDMKVFNDALNGFVGVNYTPVAVAKQVVAGMNYSFFCNKKGVYPGALNEAATVLIYFPPSGTPHITAITNTAR